jgi:gamma-glutamylputrescine oxidase
VARRAVSLSGVVGTVGNPFWGRATESYPGALPDKADVLVVGGGITGVSLLHHLGRRRIQAVLVERHRIAAGASGRNAGFLLAGVASSYAEAVRVHGRERAREIWALTGDNHDLMIEATRGQEIGYTRRGSEILASGEEERRQLEESAHLLSEDGFQARWDGLRLANPRDGELDPVALVATLARQARAGAIREGVEVTALEPRRNDVVVRAGDAACEAGLVILATNAYTPLLVPAVDIRPKRAQMLATAPVAATVAELPTYSHSGYRYWRQLKTHELLIGGWRDTAPEAEVGYAEETTPSIQQHLERAAEGLGARAEPTHRWAGIMGFTESGLPLTGPVEGIPNIELCAGFNGHGLGFAFVSARHVAQGI